MKIEKINDNQIRCTLNSDDLATRQIKLSELAYGSEKAKNLFRDMMIQAQDECGFEADNLPLMIEAIPITADRLSSSLQKWKTRRTGYPFFQICAFPMMNPHTRTFPLSQAQMISWISSRSCAKEAEENSGTKKKEAATAKTESTDEGEKPDHRIFPSRSGWCHRCLPGPEQLL